jgi:N-acetylglucosamine kinase-like BadF-type ATPase
VICSRQGLRWVKSGARGYLLGNPGSAFRYGQDALLHFLDYPSDTTESTRSLIEKVFGSTEETAVIAKLYRNPAPAAILAKLAPAVARDERMGLAYAQESLRRQTAGLAAQTAEHIKKYIAGRAQIGLAGGVWELSQSFLQAFEQALCGLLPQHDLCIVRIQRPPVQGAAELAKEMV